MWMNDRFQSKFRFKYLHSVRNHSKPIDLNLLSKMKNISAQNSKKNPQQISQFTNQGHIQIDTSKKIFFDFFSIKQISWANTKEKKKLEKMLEGGQDNHSNSIGDFVSSTIINNFILKICVDSLNILILLGIFFTLFLNDWLTNNAFLLLALVPVEPIFHFLQENRKRKCFFIHKIHFSCFLHTHFWSKKD